MNIKKKNRLESALSKEKDVSKFGKIFVSYFTARGFMTQKQICESIGINPASLQDLIYGIRKTNFGWVEKTIEKLSLNKQEQEILINAFQDDLSNWG